jgi:hypothetical protein
MGDILARALKDELIAPTDVVRHVPPAEWVKDAPPHILSELLAVGLARGNFDAKLALVHLTPEVMAEHLSPPLLWRCIAEAVERAFDLGDARAQAATTLEKAAASMSAAKLEAMVVRKSPLETAPREDPEGWDISAVSVGDDEIVEETNPGPPAPPRPSPSPTSDRRAVGATPSPARK